MIIQDIDKGKDFDWGKTSSDYAKTARMFWTWEQAPVFFQGICTSTEPSGPEQI